MPQGGEQTLNQSQGRESAEGQSPSCLSTGAVGAKGPEVGTRTEGPSHTTGHLGTISSCSEKADEGGLDKQPGDGLLPRGPLHIPGGLLDSDSCQGLRLEWTMSITVFNAQLNSLCASRNNHP